jgi:gamma-glutamylcyclotransferase
MLIRAFNATIPYMAPILYFAYGSNLHPARLAVRAPSARFIGTGCWPGHRLAFHKIGQDGSAKCDAPVAPQPSDRVHGAIYELADADLERLDRIEGVGTGYDRELVALDGDVGPLTANVYLARQEWVDPGLRPFDWYQLLVLAGAEYHSFPDSYLAAISAVSAIPDPDRGRADSNLSPIPNLKL